MTKEEAKAKAIKETGYCYVLKQAWHGGSDDGITLERIFAKKRSAVEIQLAWWSKGRLAPRPADIDAPDWITLFDRAVKGGVFTDDELARMARSLSEPAARILDRRPPETTWSCSRRAATLGRARALRLSGPPGTPLGPGVSRSGGCDVRTRARVEFAPRCGKPYP